MRSTGSHPRLSFYLLALRHRTSNKKEEFPQHLVCKAGTELKEATSQVPP
jgi:hypothetical protein